MSNEAIIFFSAGDADITQREIEARYITSYQMVRAVNSQPIRELQFATGFPVPIKQFQGQLCHRKRPFDWKDTHLLLQIGGGAQWLLHASTPPLNSLYYIHFETCIDETKAIK